MTLNELIEKLSRIRDEGFPREDRGPLTVRVACHYNGVPEAVRIDEALEYGPDREVWLL